MTLQLPGSEIEKGIVKVLDDLFGPAVREFGTGLGEWVREQRGRRLKATLERAREIAASVDERSLPPPKFLVPYLENASLEEDDDALTSMWAALLVDASSAYSSGHPVFVDILKRLDKSAAEVFDQIVERPTVRRKWLSQLEDCDMEYRFRDLRNEIIDVSDVDAGLWLDRILQTYSRFGAALWRFHADRPIEGFDEHKEETEEYVSFEFVDAFEDGDLSLSALEALGLVRSQTVHVATDAGGIFCHLVWVSRLGTEFYFATHDRNASLIPEERPAKSGGYPDEEDRSESDPSN